MTLFSHTSRHECVLVLIFSVLKQFCRYNCSRKCKIKSLACSFRFGQRVFSLCRYIEVTGLCCVGLKIFILYYEIRCGTFFCELDLNCVIKQNVRAPNEAIDNCRYRTISRPSCTM